NLTLVQNDSSDGKNGRLLSKIAWHRANSIEGSVSDGPIDTERAHCRSPIVIVHTFLFESDSPWRRVNCYSCSPWQWLFPPLCAKLLTSLSTTSWVTTGYLARALSLRKGMARLRQSGEGWNSPRAAIG